MSTDIFRRYLDLLNEAETRVKLVANQPVIPGQPLSSVQMAVVDIARSMGNQMGPEVDRAYDLAKQAGVRPGPVIRDRTDSADTQSVKTNTRSGQPPTNFTPTHFHKNNLGSKIPLMQTPDGSFWWMTTDPETPRAGKTIQPWFGNTENRSLLSGTASVDGVFKDGKAIEFPEGMTWKEYAASAEKSPQAALPAAKSRQIEPELLAPLEPTDSERKLVAPNTSSSGTFSNDQALANLAAKIKDSSGTVALPSSGTFSNDQALANLAAKIKDSSGMPAAAKISTDSAASKKSDKEPMITDSSRCAQCGTPKSIHTPLKHQFVPGDDVRPAAVGGSQSSSDTSTKPSTDTLAADQARIDKMAPYTRPPVSAKPALPPKPLPPKPSRPGSLKEDINQLPVADQMRAWQQLMEAPSGPTAAQQAAQRAGLGRPGAVGVGNKPDTRNLTDKLKAQDKLRDFDNIDRQVPKPKVPASTAGFLQPVSPNSPLGRAQATAPAVTPPAAPADWKAKVKLGMKRIAAPAAAIYSIYEGWTKISALPKDKMSRAQYAAEVTKIVARLVQENGIVLVSTTLGGLAGAPMGGVGAIPGMVAGAAGGLAAEYYFGDDISKVVNGVVDHMYGTDKTPEPQQNKPTPAEVAENKTYLEGMAVWIAGGGIPDEKDKKVMDAARALLKSAGVTVAPAPQAAEKVPAADSVAKYKETFDKANAIVDKIKNVDPKDDPKQVYIKINQLATELVDLLNSEIGTDRDDPAIKPQIDSILADVKAIWAAKQAESDSKVKSVTGGPKEGQTGTVPGNPPKKVIFKNGKWVPQ